MAYPVVTSMDDINRDVPQPASMVENIIIVAVSLALAAEKPAVDHVVDQDPGGRQSVFLTWLAVAVFIPAEPAGAAFPSDTGRCGCHQPLPFRVGVRRRE